MNQAHQDLDSAQKKYALRQTIHQRLQSLQDTDLSFFEETLNTNFTSLRTEIIEMLDVKRAQYFSKIQALLKAHFISYELALKKYDSVLERSRLGQLKGFEEASEYDSLDRKIKAQDRDHQIAMTQLLSQEQLAQELVTELAAKYSPKQLRSKEEPKKQKKTNQKNIIEVEGVLMRLDSESNRMKTFDLRTLKFKEIQAQLEAPKDSAYFQLSGNLFISGGIINNQPSAQLISALLDGSVMKYHNMHHKRKHHSLTGDSAHLFVSAGIGSDALDSCQMFTLAYDKWETIASCNQARSHHGSCFMKSEILYIFGGRAGEDQICIIERMVMGSGKWDLIEETGAFIPSKCLTAIGYQETMIVFGSLKTMQTLVFSGDSGTYITELDSESNPDGTHGACHTLFKGSLYLMDDEFQIFRWSEKEGWKEIE